MNNFRNLKKIDYIALIIIILCFLFAFGIVVTMPLRFNTNNNKKLINFCKRLSGEFEIIDGIKYCKYNNGGVITFIPIIISESELN